MFHQNSLRKSIFFNRKFISNVANNILQDNYNRTHNYLRISLTERCNLRCKYCMPEEGIKLNDKESYLKLDELKRLSNLFVKLCGVDKIRLTGGEPTIDKKLLPLLEHINGLKQYGLKTIAMTTNGLTLKKNSSIYKSLGLNCVNISLDTLKKERYELITRKKGFNLVYDGILKAIEVKFDKIKLNCVVIKGFNDDEMLDFVELAKKFPIEVRFIEFMPFQGNHWSTERMLSYKEMLNIILHEYPNLARLESMDNDVSKVYKESSLLGSIGFISSISDNFCSTCNRLRLTADGHLKVCLFGREETSLKDLIRNSANDEEVLKCIQSTLKRKKKQHAGATNLIKELSRPMIKIGKQFSMYQQYRMIHCSKFSLQQSSSSTNDAITSHLEFNHVDNTSGKIKMVNVGEKVKMKRIAIAEGKILVGKTVLSKLETIKKGDVLTVAKISGLMGAKLTSQLIPLCHQIPLDYVDINIKVCNESKSLLVRSTVEAHHNTGVEMESLTAVSITLLTIYDMCKSVNKSMIISDVKLINKIKIQS